MSTNLPLAFQIQNASNSKKPILVVAIDGVDDIFSTATVGTTIRYGDGTLYGEEDDDGNPLVYGGKRPWTGPNGGTSRSYLMFDRSSLTIDQRLEPEQGRVSVSQFTLSFLNVADYFTRLCTPGMVVDEIMGREVTCYLGYDTLSFPDQYIICFRGIIQGVTFDEVRCVMQLGDCSIKRRQQIFYTAQTNLAGSINNSTTTINVDDNADFYARILGPFGTDDTTVKTYIGIDDEWIEYNRQAKASNSFNEVAVGADVTRGARGTTAASHADQAEVRAAIEISGNPIQTMLKLMLSGWNGNYLTGQTIQSLGYTGDPVIGDPPNLIRLPDGVDAIRDLGLAPGDRLATTGSGTPANNIPDLEIESIEPFGDLPNRLIYVDQDFTMEASTTAVFAARSQYDVYPTEAGLKMTGQQVDVAAFQALFASFFAQEAIRLFQTFAEHSGKEFIESQLNLPMSLYSITVEGRVSAKATLPPIAGETLQVLDASNVLDPAHITVIRGLTNRKFFNEIDFFYDETDEGVFPAIQTVLDSDSLENIGQLSVLPIQSRATKSDLTSITQIQNRLYRLLNRYKNACLMYTLRVNFGVGIALSIGDIVLVRDDDGLKIPDLTRGVRGIQPQLMEVIGRTIDIKAGSAFITLLSGVNFSIQDRFGTFAPSSYCANSSTASAIRVVPSFGEKFGLNEFLKWRDYVGERIVVHLYDWTVSGTATIQSVSNAGVITLESPLGFTPDENYIVDLAEYSATETQDPVSKQVHGFWTATVPVVTGTSGTIFTVGAGDIGKFEVGIPIYVRKNDWSVVSEDVLIADITGNQITVATSLGFTPNNTYSVELALMPDGGAPYRFI